MRCEQIVLGWMILCKVPLQCQLPVLSWHVLMKDSKSNCVFFTIYYYYPRSSYEWVSVQTPTNFMLAYASMSDWHLQHGCLEHVRLLYAWALGTAVHSSQ